MVMISVSQCPKLILEQCLCVIRPVTLSDTITLRGSTHKEGLKPESEAQAKNNHGIRPMFLMSPVGQKQAVTYLTHEP